MRYKPPLVAETGQNPAGTAWDHDKEQMRSRLIEVARAGDTINYERLAEELGSAFPYGPRTRAFYDMLTEIAKEEDAAGRGLLSVVVVGKGRGLPGAGFFRAAEERGRDVSDERSLAVAEGKRVHSQWRPQSPAR